MADKVVGAVETVGSAVGQTIMKVGEVFGIDLDPTAGTIFVTGGTGVIGYRVASKLLQSGYPTVRIGAKKQDDDTVAALNKMGAEVADFAWDDETTYDKALQGVKSVLCIPAYEHGWHRKFTPFLEACKKAGVKHFVKMSFYHAHRKGDYFRTVPLIKAHGDGDERLMETHGNMMSYTILAATHLMSNPLVYQAQTLHHDLKPATFYGASAGKGVNYVSPNDIAEVAVRCLLEPKAHHNKEYSLTGPAAIKDQEVASLLSKYLQKPVMYVDQPIQTFEDQEKMGGDAAWMVKDLVALEKLKAEGLEEDVGFVTNDIEKICNRFAQTYDEYLSTYDAMSPKEQYPDPPKTPTQAVAEAVHQGEIPVA